MRKADVRTLDDDVLADELVVARQKHSEALLLVTRTSSDPNDCALAVRALRAGVRAATRLLALTRETTHRKAKRRRDEVTREKMKRGRGDD